jgi:alpha-2-macroglobulin
MTEPAEPAKPEDSSAKKEEGKGKPRHENKFLRGLLGLIKLALWIFVPIMILTSSPVIRAAFSPMFLSLDFPNLDLPQNPATITTKERLSIVLRAERMARYKLKLYKKDYRDFADLLPDVTADGFNLDPKPPINNEQAFQVLWNKNPLTESQGNFHFTDFLQAEAIETLPSPLPAGDYIYLVEAERRAEEAPNFKKRTVGVFRVSDLGLIVKQAPDKILVKAVDLNTLSPVVGARVEAFLWHCENSSGASTEKQVLSFTGKDGITEIPILSFHPYGDQTTIAITAKKLDNFACDLDASTSQTLQCNTNGMAPAYRNFSNYTAQPHDFLTTKFVTDRTVYRLGQTVFLKGIVRKVTAGGLENPQSNQNIELTVTNPDGQTIKKSRLKTGAFGDFNSSFQIPANDKTGQYNVQAALSTEVTCSTTIEVSQYRKPEYIVELSPLSSHTVAGEALKVKLQAKYFFGGPVKNARVRYNVHSQPDYQVRKKLKTQPAYYAFFEDDAASPYPEYYGYNPESFNAEGDAVTNDAGEAELSIKSAAFSKKKTGPFDESMVEQDYTIDATVTDVSRKTVEGTGTALVTASDLALILETSNKIVQSGQHINARVRAVDYQNRPAANQQIRVTLEHWDYDYSASTYSKPEILLTKTVQSGPDGTASIDLLPDSKTAGGNYSLCVESEDGSGRRTRDCNYVWIQGENMAGDLENSPTIQIHADREIYKPGETIRALIAVPAGKRSARTVGLLTLEGRTILHHQDLDLSKGSGIFEIKAEAAQAPCVYLGVATVNEKHQFMFESCKLKIYPEPFLLNLQIAGDKSTYEPGQEATIKIQARHQNGEPAANAQLAIALADESIFSIRPESDIDISHFFYGNQDNWVQTFISFDPQADFKPQNIGLWDNAFLNCLMAICTPRCQYECAQMAPGAGGAPSAAPLAEAESPSASLSAHSAQYAQSAASSGRKDKGVAAKAVTIRENFRDTAFWSPDLVTDKTGTAQVKVKLPDNLTTWRATVAAISGRTDTGCGTAKLTVSKEIVARLSLPRFYTERDEAAIIGIVHNYSSQKQNVILSLAPSEQFKLGAAAQQTLELLPQAEGEFSWPVKILAEGSGKLTFSAKGTTAGDGLVQKLPIRSFSYPAFACKNGVLKEDHDSIKLPCKLTADARPGSGHFTLNLASSTIGPVLGNFDKLIDYPYGCTEQTMSRMVPSIVAMQLHKKLAVPLSDKAAVRFHDVYREGLKTIISYQNSDGGWGWWAGDSSNTYLTSYVLEGLYLLKEAGFAYDSTLTQTGTAALKERTSASILPAIFNAEPAADNAYAMYALSLFGVSPSDMALKWQMRNLSSLTPEGLSYLTLALHRAGKKQEAGVVYSRLLALANKSWEFTNWDHTTELIHKMGLKDCLDYSYRFTGTESSALALRAVIAMEPENEKLQNSIRRWILLQHDEDGWQNTKTTAAVFLSLLADESNAGKGKASNFTASAAAGGKTLASLVFNEKNRYAAENTISFAVKGSEEFLELKKNGSGRLYYNSLLRYDRPIKLDASVVPRSSPPDLVVERKFFTLHPYIDKETKQPRFKPVPLTADGTKAGEIILMKVSIKSPIPLPYIVVDAALPSGAEVVSNESSVNQELDAGAGENPDEDASAFSYWWTHQDILDDRIVFFVTNMRTGRSEFQALLRMEMPGKFNVVPVSFEGMYSKAVRGYSAADQVLVTGP